MNEVAFLRTVAGIASTVTVLCNTLVFLIMRVRRMERERILYSRTGAEEWEQPTPDVPRATVVFDDAVNYRTAPRTVPAPELVPMVRTRDVPPFQVAVAVLLAGSLGYLLAIITHRA